MLFLNIKIIFLIIVSFTYFTYGEQQLSPNEFLQYFSTAAGIHSLVFSLSNTIYSIKRLNQFKKKNRGFNEGINDSVIKSKEVKSRKQVVNNNISLYSIDFLDLSKLEMERNDIDIAHLINQTNNLTEIEMVKYDMFNENNNTDFKKEYFENLIENCDQYLHSNNSRVKNLNYTISQNIDIGDGTSGNFRGVVIE